MSDSRILEELGKLNKRMDDLMSFIVDQTAGVPRRNPKEEARQIAERIRSRTAKKTRASAAKKKTVSN